MSPSSTWTTAEVVHAFAGHALLRKYQDEVEAGEITGSDLADLMDEATVSEMFGLASKLVVKKVTAAIRTLVGPSDSAQAQKDRAPPAEPTKQKSEDRTSKSLGLPAGKR